jgi:hypothetical protein
MSRLARALGCFATGQDGNGDRPQDAVEHFAKGREAPMQSRLLSANHPDKVKKWRPCLGCGKRMFTDRGHRLCRKCQRRVNDSPGRQSYHLTLPAVASGDDL